MAYGVPNVSLEELMASMQGPEQALAQIPTGIAKTLTEAMTEKVKNKRLLEQMREKAIAEGVMKGTVLPTITEPKTFQGGAGLPKALAGETPFTPEEEVIVPTPRPAIPEYLQGKKTDFTITPEATQEELFYADPITRVTYSAKTGEPVTAVPKTGKVIMAQIPFEQKEEIKRRSTARKDLDRYTSDATQSLVALNKMEEASKKLGDFKRGIVSQTISKGGVMLDKLAKNKEYVQYRGIIDQELIPAARKLMEEKGPITETDVARVESGLGDITVPLEDKLFLLNQLRTKVKEALQNKLEVAGISLSEFAQKNPNLYKSLFEQTEQAQPTAPVQTQPAASGEAW